MTTQADVRKLLKPIQSKHPHYALHKRCVIATPVLHVARYFVLDGSRGKASFKPRFALLPMCVPYPRLHLSYGWTFWNNTLGPWDIFTPDTPDVLMHESENGALPILEAVRTLEDFMKFTATEHSRGDIYLRTQDRIIIESALGNLDAARKIWTNELSTWTERHYLHFDDEPANMRRRQTLGACLMADDRAGIAALLHEFEAFTVASNKLEKHWERTPFPMEAL
jgi:hypothetical protein